MYIKYYINLTYNENVVYDWNCGTLIQVMQKEYCYKKIMELFKENDIDIENIACIKIYVPYIKGYITFSDEVVLKVNEFVNDNEHGVIEMVLIMKNRNEYYERKINESLNDIRNMSMCLQKVVNSKNNNNCNCDIKVEKRRNFIVQYFYTKILVNNNGNNFNIGSAYKYEIEIIKELLSKVNNAELYVDVLTNESSVESIARCLNIIVVNTYGECNHILYESCFDSNKHGTYNEVNVMEFFNNSGIKKCELVIMINCKKEIGEYVINKKLIKNVIVIQPYTSNNSDYNNIKQNLTYIYDLFHFILKGYNICDAFNKAKYKVVNNSCYLYLDDNCKEIKLFDQTNTFVDNNDLSQCKCQLSSFDFGIQNKINSFVYKIISNFIRIIFIHFDSFQFMNIISNYIGEYYHERKVITNYKIEIHLWRTLLNEYNIFKSIYIAINNDNKFNSVKDVYTSIKHKKYLIIIYCHKCYIDNASTFIKTLTAFTENTFEPRIMFCFDNNISICNEITKHKFTSLTLDNDMFHKVIINNLSSLINTPLSLLTDNEYICLFNDYLKRITVRNDVHCLKQCELIIYVFALCGVPLIGKYLSCYNENCFMLLVNAHIMLNKDNVLFELKDDICDFNQLLHNYKSSYHKQSILILVEYVDTYLNDYLDKLCCDLNKDIDMYIDLPLLNKFDMLNTKVDVDLDNHNIEYVLYLVFFDNKEEFVPSLDLILKVMLYFKYKKNSNDDIILTWVNHFNSNYSDNETIYYFLSLFNINPANRIVIPIKYDNIYLYYYSLILNKTNINENVFTLLNDIIQFDQSTHNVNLTQLLFAYIFDICLSNKKIFHHLLTIIKYLKPSLVTINRIKVYIYLQLCQFNISICNVTKSQLYFTNAKALVKLYNKGILYMKLTTLHKQLLILNKYIQWNHMLILHSNPLVCLNNSFTNYYSTTSFINHFHKLSSLHKHIPFTYKSFTKRNLKQAITAYSGKLLILKSNDFILNTKTNVNAIVIENKSKESKLMNYNTLLSICDNSTIQFDIIILAFICGDISQYVNLFLSKGAQYVIVLTINPKVIDKANDVNVIITYEESVNIFILKFIKEYIQRNQIVKYAFDSANNKLQRYNAKSFIISNVYYNTNTTFHLSLFNMLYYVKGNICCNDNPTLVNEDIVCLNKKYKNVCERNLDLYNVLSCSKRNDINIINVYGMKDNAIDSFMFHLYYLFVIEYPKVIFKVSCVNKKQISDLCCKCKEMNNENKWRYVFIDNIESVSEKEMMKIMCELIEVKCKVIVKSKSKIKLGMIKESNVKLFHYELTKSNNKFTTTMS